jgi:hypothetical protein
MKNWKTTLFAILAVLPQVLKLFPNLVNPSILDAASIILGALGIGYAKDHNVTGGTVANTVSDASVVKETAKTDKP